MPNAFVPRDQVHAWSEAMADEPEAHSAGLTRLLRDQRRLTRFIQENAEDMEPATAGVANYLFAVLARIFDLAGGRLKSATWAQVRAAQAKVGAAAAAVLPWDDGAVERVRALADRAQPHVLDEALMTLFDKEQREDEVEVSPEESVKLFFLMWVAVEVLDGNWRPPKGFVGETEYVYMHIEPEPAEGVGWATPEGVMPSSPVLAMLVLVACPRPVEVDDSELPLDTGAVDTDDTRPCAVGEPEFPAADTGLADTAADWGWTTEACVDPDTTWEGWTVSWVRPAVSGGFWCASRQRVREAEPLDTCPSCDFAFELTFGPGEELGTTWCDWFAPEALSTLSLGVDTAHYGQPVVMYQAYTGWYPIQSYVPYSASSVELEARAAEILLRWEYALLAYSYY